MSAAWSRRVRVAGERACASFFLVSIAKDALDGRPVAAWCNAALFTSVLVWVWADRRRQLARIGRRRRTQ